MSSIDYAELEGMPKGCTTTAPWGYSPVAVLVPYGPVNDHVVQLAPVVSSDWPAHAFMSPESAYFTDVKPGATLSYPNGGLGYESSEETAARNKLKAIARATASDTAKYHPDALESIVGLASKAKDLLAGIPAKYEDFHEGGIVYRLKDEGMREPVYKSFPLSVPDDEVAAAIATDAAPHWKDYRKAAREQIRLRFHKAIRLLWCALYGKAQSESWKENKKIYDQRYKKTGIGLAAGPTAPPPVEPGEFLPPLKTGYEPEPWEEPPPTPEGEGAPTTEGAGEVIPENVPTPTRGGLPVPAGMPLASKIMLGASVALALGAGGAYAYKRLRA